MKKDLTGKIFGRLEAIAVDRERSTNNTIYWKCLCQRCQSYVSIRYSNLVRGNSKHCQSCGQIRFTEEEDVKIREMHDNGMVMTKIAKEVKSSRSAIKNSLKRTEQSNKQKEKR